MGFRGSRVQIPPSRLAEVETRQQDRGRVVRDGIARPSARARDIVGHGKKGEIPVKGEDDPDRVARVEEGDA